MLLLARALVLLASTCMLHGSNSATGDKMTTTNIDGYVKQIQEAISAFNKLLNGTYEVKDKCFYSPGSNGARPTDIYAVPRGGKSAGKVKVEVTNLYYDCLKVLKPEIVPPEKAKIWCLRVALWKKQNDPYAGDFDKGLEEAKLLQRGRRALSPFENSKYDEMKRKKRGTVDVRQIAPADITRPLTGFRTRQEYRTLTVAQRNRLHAALNEVYQDGTMTCFALVHRNALIDGGAHGGGAFLPWHRVFLALFEEALRQKDPSVSLPYWDSTLDDNMAAGPGFSVMWDNAHLGPGTGTVDAGPFAGWNTAEGPLQRAVARGNGNLVRQDRINTLLNSCLLDEFTDPWESTHDSVHVWVGGTMERSFAASDPVFYMHHAFVDYIWERFRQRQRTACGVDPATDYPPDRPDSPDHSGANPMVGMDFLRNRDGIADYWINNWFNYTDSPTCANNCGNSEDLYCDTAINRCVSDSRFDFGNPVSTTPMPGSTTSMAGSTTSMPGFTTSTPQTATSTTRTTPSTTRSSTPTSQTTTRLTTTTSRTTTTTTPISTPTTRTATVTPRTQALTSRTTTSMWTDSTLSSFSSSLTDLIPPPLDDNHTDRRPRSSDQGFYSQKVKDGQKPYEGKCSNDPYETSCAKRPMPATPDEVVNAISRNELPMSPSMKAVYDAIAKELKRGERFPPESEQQWFHMRPDEENDCRCLNKFIRDPLEAYVKDGRQLNRYGPKISQSP